MAQKANIVSYRLYNTYPSMAFPSWTALWQSIVESPTCMFWMNESLLITIRPFPAPPSFESCCRLLVNYPISIIEFQHGLRYDEENTGEDMTMFFSKKADEKMMKSFWTWFEQNEEWIIAASKTDGVAVVNAVDEKLSPAFACHGVEIEFQLGYHDGHGEFFFFDLNKRALRKDAEKLASLMPAKLQENWTFIIEH